MFKNDPQSKGWFSGLDTILVQDGEILDGGGAVVEFVEEVKEGLVLGKNSVLKNVTLVGNGKGVGVRIPRNTSRYRMDNVRVTNWGKGYDLEYCWIGTVTHCFANGCGNGINIHGKSVNDLHWIGGEINGCDNGIMVEGSDHQGSKFELCIEGNKQHGVWMRGQTECYRFRDCYFEGNGNCSVLVDCWTNDGTVIHGCVFGKFRKPEIILNRGYSAHIKECAWYGTCVDPPIIVGKWARDTIIDNNSWTTTTGIVRLHADKIKNNTTKVTAHAPWWPRETQWANKL